MADKPKTDKQIKENYFDNACKNHCVKWPCNEYREGCSLRKAFSLDMPHKIFDCTKCKSLIEKEYAKRIFERIEPHITNALFQLHYDKDFESEMTWWQQLRQEYGI